MPETDSIRAIETRYKGSPRGTHTGCPQRIVDAYTAARSARFEHGE